MAKIHCEGEQLLHMSMGNFITCMEMPMPALHQHHGGWLVNYYMSMQRA
jgi:hypothetical protein